MKSFFKKALAGSLSALMLASCAAPAMAADSSDVDYVITNPYETVDWENWNQYKAMLHAHTLYSDASISISESVEEYYAQGYDILAITDHGVVNQGWDTIPEMLPLIGYNQYIKKLEPISAERYKEITTGADRDGRGMLDVEQGIEMNGVVMRKNHVNGFFCGYGQGIWGVEEDYETPVAETEKAGGISFINHPGDFYTAHNNIDKANDYSNLKDWCEIYMKYKSCVGLEVFNEDDVISRYDRVIWDNILKYTIPRGRVVWAFGNDDSHVLSDIGLTAQMFLMPENTNEALRTAMEDGTFFVCSRFAKVEMGDEFEGTGDYATVTNIAVDEDEDIISVTIESNSDYTVEWIADGEIIAYGDSIDLDMYSDSIRSYVRFQIKNEGGILLSQPFVTDDGNFEEYQFELPEDPDYGTLGNYFYNLYLKLRRTLLGELIYSAAVLDQ